jgi:hypothetical protein
MRQQLTAAKPNCLVAGLQKFELLINVGCILREKIFEFRQQGLAATVSNQQINTLQIHLISLDFIKLQLDLY